MYRKMKIKYMWDNSVAFSLETKKDQYDGRPILIIGNVEIKI